VEDGGKLGRWEIIRGWGKDWEPVRVRSRFRVALFHEEKYTCDEMNLVSPRTLSPGCFLWSTPSTFCLELRFAWEGEYSDLLVVFVYVSPQRLKTKQ